MNPDFERCDAFKPESGLGDGRQWFTGPLERAVQPPVLPWETA
jgi:hypothetical protein